MPSRTMPREKAKGRERKGLRPGENLQVPGMESRPRVKADIFRKIIELEIEARYLQKS